MLSTEYHRHLSIKTPSALFAPIKKMIPWRRDKGPAGLLQEDLERLAQTAPHILPDIGFVPDVKASSPGTIVWRKGALSVSISTAVQSTSVSIP